MCRYHQWFQVAVIIYYSKVKVKIFAFRAIDRFLVLVTLTFDFQIISAMCNLEAMLYLKSLMHVTHPKIWKKNKKIPGFVGR